MTNTALVVRAQHGDREAFDLVLTVSIDHLYRIARLMLRDVDSAEDAVQEALVRCWRDLPALREPARFDAWLKRLLMRAITDEARARSRRRLVTNVVLLQLEPTQDDAGRALANRDEMARLFDRLSMSHRAVVVLHYYLDMTVEEVAATLAIPVGTAKSRLHYANEALRAALEADVRIGATREMPA